MLLLDKDGNREENWQIHFSLGDVNPDIVVHSFLVGGALESFDDTEVETFAHYIERPFNISTEDIIILNRGCSYDQSVVDALREMIRDQRHCNVLVHGAGADELSSIVSDLTRAQLMAFRFRRPLWVSRALHRPLRKGERGQSDKSANIRKAIHSWTVVAEQIVRHSLVRAKKDRTAFVNNRINIPNTSANLVQHFLGWDRWGDYVEVGIPGTNITRIALEPFKFDTSRREARRVLFPSSDLEPSFYSDKAEDISADIQGDIANFQSLNPGHTFDAFALAGWTLRVLLWLRLSYSVSKSVDAHRSDARRKLVNTRNDEEIRAIAARFSVLRVAGVNAIRTVGRRTSRDRISDTDLMGLGEAVLVAFFADLDFEFFQEHYLLAAEDRSSLFSMARWFGRFYRQRNEYLTTELARSYLHVVSMSHRQQEEGSFKEIGVALSMMTSFLTPSGLTAFQGAANLAVQENVGRKIYASAPDYGAPGDNGACTITPARRRRLSEASGDAIPLPIFVPAGRLLLPGDYSNEWVSKCRALLRALET